MLLKIFFPLWYTPGDWIEFPGPYSRTLLFIHSKCNSLTFCNGCFLEVGAVTWNLLASASGAAGRESDRIQYRLVWDLHPSRTSHITISVSARLFLALFSLLLVLPVVEEVEAGHAIALLLGVILSITGICACFGVFARKRNGQMWLWRASWIKPSSENLCAIEFQNWALVSESSQETVNRKVSYYWLFSYKKEQIDILC